MPTPPTEAATINVLVGHLTPEERAVATGARQEQRVYCFYERFRGIPERMPVVVRERMVCTTHTHTQSCTQIDTSRCHAHRTQKQSGPAKAIMRAQRTERQREPPSVPPPRRKAGGAMTCVPEASQPPCPAPCPARQRPAPPRHADPSPAQLHAVCEEKRQTAGLAKRRRAGHNHLRAARRRSGRRGHRAAGRGRRRTGSTCQCTPPRLAANSCTW